MFNFKALAAAASHRNRWSLCTLDAVSAVEAKADQCRKVAGFDVCYRDNGNYGADRIAVWTNDYNVADMTVICTGGGGNRWEATRDAQYVSYGDLEALADRWCRDY